MARETICGIYKITNLINGKVYIGESVDIYRRWEQHKKIGKSKNGYKRDAVKPLYRAMHKYGLDNFLFEIIEICCPEDRFERETYWIAYYDCTLKNNKGYNQNYGGEGSYNLSQMREVYQYDLQGNFVARYNSIKEATVAIGANYHNGLVQNAIGKENKQAGGYQWRYEYVDKLSPYKIVYKCYKVACYNENGQLEQVFNSVKEAAQYFDCSISAIEYCCQGKSKFCKHKIFKYYEDVPLDMVEVPILKRAGRKGKPVMQIKDGEIVNIFKSARDASKAMNNGIVNDDGANYIGRICRKKPKHKYYKGYSWKFLHE